MKQQKILFSIAVGAVVFTGLIAATVTRERAQFVQTTGLVTSATVAELPPEVLQLPGSVVPQLQQAVVNYIVEDEVYELRFERPAPAYQYVFGETIAVYYDPAQPATAVLAPADLRLGNRALLLSISGGAIGYLLLQNTRTTPKKRR